MRARIIALFIFTTLVALDRLTKWFFIVRFSDKSEFSTFHLIDIVSHKNYGIIANFPLPRLVTIIVTIIAIGVIIFFIQRRQEKTFLQQLLALHVLLAGAIGNLWDRIQWGYVYDWLLLGGRSAINLADICVVIGMGWYVLNLRNSTSKSFFSP